ALEDDESMKKIMAPTPPTSPIAASPGGAAVAKSSNTGTIAFIVLGLGAVVAIVVWVLMTLRH
ncbi:MAG: hypothetical protein U0169_23465, partial [Polyangiaceae bacterium]